LVHFKSSGLQQLINTLEGVVKKLCRDAGIEGNFTNHSLRTTMATRGLVKGIPDKLIMENRSWRRKVVTAVSET
jgi:integrase